MTITTFDRPTCRLLRADLDAALAAVAEKHGISLTCGKMTYTGATVTMSLKGAVGGESLESIEFKRYAPQFGLLTEDLGREVRLNGAPFTICGLRPKAYKRPVLLTGADGRQVVCSTNAVQRALGREVL